MVRRIGLCLCMAWAYGSGMASGTDAPPTGAIAGRAVDVGGKPVVGAEVWGISWGAAAREEVGRTKTDAEGRFRLAPLKVEKPVDLWFDAPGMARERSESIHVFEGRDHDIGSMVLVAGTKVAGKVVDAKGSPIGGAKLAIEVSHRSLSHTTTSDQKKWTLDADASGRFETPALPSGEAALSFASPGKVRTRLDRRTVPGTAAIELGDVKLDDEVPVSGVVLDKAGQPAPKVEVMADYDYVNTTRTDDLGKFTLGGLGQAAKDIRLTSNDYFAPKPFPIGLDRLNLRLEVTKAFEIKGTAVDAETGVPVNLDTVRLCIVVHEPDGTTSLRG